MGMIQGNGEGEDDGEERRQRKRRRKMNGQSSKSRRELPISTVVCNAFCCDRTCLNVSTC